MNLHNEQKRYISDNIKISFTSIGIANLCDYVICDRYFSNTDLQIDNQSIMDLKTGDKLFLNGFNIQRFPDIIHHIIKILLITNVKLNFYIGVIEPTLNDDIITLLLPFAENIYCTNNVHPNCKILPIGLRDGEEVFPIHKHFSGQDILNEMQHERDKNILCLLCFTNATHPTRQECENILKNKVFVYDLNNDATCMWSNYGGKLNTDKDRSIHCGLIPQWLFYENCHKSYYTLCPRGAGEDTHRFFEAIALNSIPIVKRTNTPFDQTFYFYPCLIINNWEEVTAELLLNNLDVKSQELAAFHAKYPDFLTNPDTVLKMLNNL